MRDGICFTEFFKAPFDFNVLVEFERPFLHFLLAIAHVDLTKQISSLGCVRSASISIYCILAHNHDHMTQAMVCIYIFCSRRVLGALSFNTTSTNRNDSIENASSLLR